MMMKLVQKIINPSPDYVLTFDETGKLTHQYVQRKNNMWQDRRSAYSPVKGTPGCALAFPPGMCALRTITLEDGNKRQALQAIEYEAEATLFDHPDKGWTTIRTYSHQDTTFALLAWCKKTYLEKCRGQAEKAGFKVTGVWVPELCLGQYTPTLLCYATAESTCIFYLSKQVPPLVQTSPADGLSAKTLAGAILNEVNTLSFEKPTDTFIWIKDADDRQNLSTELGSLSIPAPPVIIQSWADVLPHLAPVGQTPEAFVDFINTRDRQKLEPAGKFRLFSFVFMTVLALALFFFSFLIQEEKDVKRLQKATAQITRASKKASQATSLIRGIQEKTDLLRTFTQDKPYLLTIIRDITEAVSTESRLDSLSVNQTGAIAIQGESKDEVLVTSIVKNMEESPLINDCRLNAMEKDPKTGVFRFSIEAKSDQWEQFFQAEARK
jgi:hypothetical protein